MGIIVIPRIPWEWEKCGENTMGMEVGAAGIVWGWNLFILKPRGDTLEILPTIKIRVQTLEF